MSAFETEQPAEAEPARQWATLGSADDSDSNPYRMLVTLSNQGDTKKIMADAVALIESADPGGP